VRHEPDPEREGQKTDTSRLPEHTITADRLILAAGTLGTTFLLLNNRRAFPGLSARHTVLWQRRLGRLRLQE
jgi:cholesterol oxidase